MQHAELTEDQDTFDAIISAIDAIESDPARHISIQIDRTLRDAILAAKHSGKSAKVTIAVNVKPELDRRVSFAAKVNASLPRPPVPEVTLYADAEGNVLKADPAQTRLDFYDSRRKEN